MKRTNKKNREKQTVDSSTVVMTEREAATYLSLSRATLRRSRMECKGGGSFPTPPFLKLGRTVRYLKGDLDAWLASHRVGG